MPGRSALPSKGTTRVPQFGRVDVGKSRHAAATMQDHGHRTGEIRQVPALEKLSIYSHIIGNKYPDFGAEIGCLEHPSRHLGGKTINRTSDTTVTFTRPFVIDGFEQELPAGDYVIETEEELIQGLSFPAYRRVSTTLHVDRIPGRPGQKESWQIVPEALEAALIRDGVGTRASGLEFK